MDPYPVATRRSGMFRNTIVVQKPYYVNKEDKVLRVRDVSMFAAQF